MTRDYDAWLATFHKEIIVIAGVKTAAYTAPEADGKPIVLFVHGINGDYHGLVPVAYLVRDVCRAVFVDMPGHGGSELPQDEDVVALMSNWAHSLPEALQNIGIMTTAAVGHSFGSYIVQETGADTMMLLNPPFGATPLSRTGTAVLGHVPSVVAKAYQSETAMIYRGQWLMHTRTKETDEIVAWSSALTHVTQAQFKFQAKLADIVAPQRLMNTERLRDVSRLGIVLAQYDKIVDNSSASLDELPNATIVTLPTNHVSIFEMPERVAEELKRLLAV